MSFLSTCSFNQNTFKKRSSSLKSRALSVLLVFAISWGNGQTMLQGKITDSATGEPILFGTVTLYENDQLVVEVKTNLDGYYYFGGIASGTYDLEARYIGYRPKRIQRVLVEPMGTKKVNAEIKEWIEDDYYYPILNEMKSNKGLDPGSYEIVANQKNYITKRIQNVSVKLESTTERNISFPSMPLCKLARSIYKVPPFDLHDTISGGIFSASDIRRLAKNI